MANELISIRKDPNTAKLWKKLVGNAGAFRKALAGAAEDADRIRAISMDQFEFEQGRLNIYVSCKLETLKLSIYKTSKVFTYFVSKWDVLARKDVNISRIVIYNPTVSDYILHKISSIVLHGVIVNQKDYTWEDFYFPTPVNFSRIDDEDGIGEGKFSSQIVSRNDKRNSLCEALSIVKDSSDGEVRRAFRSFALNYHPDKTTNINKRAEYIRVQNLYESCGF